MNNFLTFHTEATPDGVNIMYRSNDGMTERVEAVSYIDAVNRLDAGDYDDKPDEGVNTSRYCRWRQPGIFRLHITA